MNGRVAHTVIPHLSPLIPKLSPDTETSEFSAHSDPTGESLNLTTTTIARR